MIQSASEKYCQWLTSNSFKKTSILYLANWSVNNLLSFNIVKLVFMSFHRKFDSSCNVNDDTISKSTTCKDLAWHCTHLLGKTTMKWAYKSLGLLHRVFKSSDCTQARKSLYIALVRIMHCIVETLLNNGYWFPWKNPAKSHQIHFISLPFRLQI